MQCRGVPSLGSFPSSTAYVQGGGKKTRRRVTRSRQPHRVRQPKQQKMLHIAVGGGQWVSSRTSKELKYSTGYWYLAAASEWDGSKLGNVQ